METKKCPYCGEEILAVAKKCKHCGEWLEKMEEEIPASHVKTEPVNDTRKEKTFFRHYFVDVYIRHWKLFSGEMSRRDYWLSAAALWIMQLGLAGLCLFMVYVSPVLGFVISMTLLSVFNLFVFVPSVGCILRRLRNAGFNPTLALSGFIPVVGPIVLVVLLCKKAKDEIDKEDTECVRFKTVDWIVALLSVAIFVVSVICLYSQYQTANANSEKMDDIIEQLEVMKNTDGMLDDVNIGSEDEEMELDDDTETLGDPDIWNLNGTIAGKDVIMQLTVIEGQVKGKYRYYSSTSNAWLYLKGEIDDQQLSMEEFDERGTNTAVFECLKTYSEGILSGLSGWIVNQKGQKYSVELNINYNINIQE